MIFTQISSQEFNVSYCQVCDLGGVAEQNYKHFKFKVSDRCSILLICKRWCFEKNGNKNWAEILQWFLHRYLLKSSMFHIVKYEIWAGLMSKFINILNLKCLTVVRFYWFVNVGVLKKTATKTGQRYFNDFCTTIFSRVQCFILSSMRSRRGCWANL
jgi:hypothetical protein